MTQAVIKELKNISLKNIDPFSFGNPRGMTEDELQSLCHSIKELGNVQPIIVRKIKSKRGRFEIIDGHHRYAALGVLGYKETSALVIDCDDVTARTVAIAVNNISGSFDGDRLAKYITELIEDVDSPEWLTKVTGITDDELNKLIKAGQKLVDQELGKAGKREPTITGEDFVVPEMGERCTLHCQEDGSD